ncbi:hypothetical protein FQN53_003757 [Emmonsiellopsis sp. PD_33]|nr:hypothetical protein FQN53_003757 [Emmonsiellopsis sp. PD_33]
MAAAIAMSMSISIYTQPRHHLPNGNENNASAKCQGMGIFIGIDQTNKLQHQQAYNGGPDKTHPRSAGLEHRLMDGDRDMDVWLHARADDDDGDCSLLLICLPLKIIRQLHNDAKQVIRT